VICGSRSAFYGIRGMKHHHNSFHAVGGPGADAIKRALGHVTLNLCFVSDAICGSRSAFGCVQGAKHQRTTFHALMGPVRIIEKAQWDTLHQTCIFYFRCNLWVT
jgi:hypothetical protein